MDTRLTEQEQTAVTMVRLTLQNYVIDEYCWMAYRYADNLIHIDIACDRVHRKELSKILPRCVNIEGYGFSSSTTVFTLSIVVDRYLRSIGL